MAHLPAEKLYFRTVYTRWGAWLSIVANQEEKSWNVVHSSRKQASAWPLAPLDSVERIAEEFMGLMRECQVEDVRLVKEVQTDREHGIPFFVTVNDPAAQSHGLH